jgi:hypothetical protein
MSDAKSYSGGCHCGQVRFDVTADLEKVYSCNCSICVKRGALWAFVPPESFALRSGAEAVVDYQFNKRVIHHLFCGQCGVGSYSHGIAPSGKEMVALNVRCLDGSRPLGAHPYPGGWKKVVVWRIGYSRPGAVRGLLAGF